MNPNESKVRSFYSDIWNNKNLDLINTLIHPDFTFRRSTSFETRGHQGFIEYLGTIHAAFADNHCAIEEIVSEDNKVFAKMNFGGMHVGEFLGILPTHKPVSWQAAALFTFSAEKISSLWVLGDMKQLEAQLAEEGAY